jgi:RNA polymerase sigma-70 factor (ECF subfamily)
METTPASSDHSPDDRSSLAHRHALFPPTMWSALAAVQGDGASALRGLERLATAYWRPLYVFQRKRGHGHEEAADGVQGFFEYLLSGELLRKARPGEGRFRNFLLVAFRRWLGDQQEKAHAAKRGGGAAAIPLHELQAAGAEPIGPGDSPEDAFDRKWAEALVARALDALADEWSGRAALFAALKCGLEGAAEAERYGETAARLGMTEGAVKTAAFELRKEFAAQVRREIRATVASDEDVEAELRQLAALLRR